MAQAQMGRQKFAALVLIEFSERKDDFQEWDGLEQLPKMLIGCDK
jgi:hypothetical protein